MPLRTAVTQSLTIIVLYTQLCHTSAGDRQPEYKMCVAECTESGQCHPIPWDLKLFGWDCEACCRYDCMMKLETAALAITPGNQHAANSTIGITSSTQQQQQQPQRPPLQYHGKWPFRRLSGIQEPASVLFSLMNWYAHYALYHQLYLPSATVITSRVTVNQWRSGGHYWQPFIRWNSLVQQNAWLWSTVFHCRDVAWTERMDYLSAMLALVGSCWLAVHRACRLDKRPRLAVCLTLVASLFFTGHCSYLLFRERFDYTYNMMAGVSVGVLHCVVWLSWSAWQYRRRPYVKWCVAAVLSAMVAMSLELLDFPPLLQAVDAHALWHLSTVPIAYLYYRFQREDALDSGQSQLKQLE